MGKCILAGHPPAGGQIGYGTYTGDCEDSKFINLGVTPKWVLVLTADGRAAQWEGYCHQSGLAIQGYPAQRGSGQPIVEITTNGFYVYYKPSAYIYSNQRYDSGPNRYIYGT